MVAMWHACGTRMDLAVNLMGEGAGNQALTWGNVVVETRGLEPLTPALQAVVALPLA
jgi:hypothetical protein